MPYSRIPSWPLVPDEPYASRRCSMHVTGGVLRPHHDGRAHCRVAESRKRPTRHGDGEPLRFVCGVERAVCAPTVFDYAWLAEGLDSLRLCIQTFLDLFLFSARLYALVFVQCRVCTTTNVIAMTTSTRTRASRCGHRLLFFLLPPSSAAACSCRRAAVPASNLNLSTSPLR